MVGTVRTEQQLLADWNAFMRLLLRTAKDHPSYPYLLEAVQRTEDAYWRRVRRQRQDRPRHTTDPGQADAAE